MLGYFSGIVHGTRMSSRLHPEENNCGEKMGAREMEEQAGRV